MTLIVAAVGLLLAAGGLFYGCTKVRPQTPLRWLVYAAVGFLLVELVAAPVWHQLGFTTTDLDEYVALIGMTLGCEVVMERILPWWL